MSENGAKRPDSPYREKIRLVCATRGSSEEFFSSAPLGRSLKLYQTFPPTPPIELRLFKDNRHGLPNLYNEAIEEARGDPAILVFIHDDVFLSDFYWARRVIDALNVFSIVGLAGSRRRLPGQPSWMFIDRAFTRESPEHLSGIVGHGATFPELRQLSVYGEPGQPVKMLDGVMIASRSTTLIEGDLKFDPRFTFHFYDVDFCRQAELKGISMGTWAISLIHASWGNLGGTDWLAGYEHYLEKYVDKRADHSS